MQATSSNQIYCPYGAANGSLATLVAALVRGIGCGYQHRDLGKEAYHYPSLIGVLLAGTFMATSLWRGSRCQPYNDDADWNGSVISEGSARTEEIRCKCCLLGSHRDLRAGGRAYGATYGEPCQERGLLMAVRQLTKSTLAARGHMGCSLH